MRRHPLPDQTRPVTAWVLLVILLLGLGLRLWHLDTKPLWLDEVLTALFTTGHSYQDVPLNQFFALSDLDRLFQVQPGLSCGELAQRVATESVHPPLFFCGLYGWMSALQPTTHWIGALRLWPALFGVGGIGAMYWLNRVAFSVRAGLLAAAFMAVSPFAVYLSQEARHYTLPMLLITLSLTALVQIQQDLIQQKRLRPMVWIGWSGLNLLGLYTHYFCLLALLAQMAALTCWMVLHRQMVVPRLRWAWGLAIATVLVGYLPWLPTMISHFNRPETDWLIPYKPDWMDRLEPLYQTLVGWTLMVVALPVEDQPRWIALPASVLMLGLMLWLAWQLRTYLPALWQQSSQRPAAFLIGCFTGCVLLQFFAIVYLLDKDLTSVPRYNFVYYPGVCALLGASFAEGMARQQAQQQAQQQRKRRRILPVPVPIPVLVVLVAGLLSSLVVVQGLAFQKSYHPDRVAQRFAFEPDRPLAVVMTYRSPQEVALGLSFALELRKRYPAELLDQQVQFAFLDRSSGYTPAWKTLAEFPQPLQPPLNLWVVASPGMRTPDYPQRLRLNAPRTPTTRPKMQCLVDPEQLYRQGFPYQLFRCQPLKKQEG